MHVTAIESAERRTLQPCSRVTATNATNATGQFSRGWLQAICFRLAGALLSLTVSACTPVGEVNRQNGQEREADAGERKQASKDEDVAMGGSEARPRPNARGGDSAASGSAGREAGSAGKGSQSSAQSSGQASAGSAANGGNKAEAGRTGTSQSAGAAGSSHETGAGGTSGRGGAGAVSNDAGKGGSNPAMGGAGMSTGGAGSAANSGWFCTPVGPSCTCVQTGQSQDDCPNPKPSCCFTLVRLGSNACTCWPEDSEECKTQTTSVPDAKPTDHCPP